METKRKRIVASLMSILMFFELLNLNPQIAYAWPGGEGEVCSASIGGRYTGSDGGDYYTPDYKPYLVYDENGNTSYATTDQRHARRKLLMTDSNGETQQIYCIEAEVEYAKGDNCYTSSSGENSRYFRNLPESVQYAIMCAAMYGWQPGKALPIDGINEDDYSYATQMIIWEYQQQIRTSPSDLHDNGQISGTMYYETLVGRPAERAYNWILDQMSKHGTIPSFASRSASSSQSYTLKYDTETGKYHLTLTDSNGIYEDLDISGADGISVRRDGNQYKFTSSRMISAPVTVKLQKDIPMHGTEMLVWGRPGYQTMMTGVEDPVEFYIRFQTETYGTCRIVKTSEDGNASGISFTVTGNNVNRTVTTDTDGTIEITDLMPGVYTITEQAMNQYEPQNSKKVTISSGQTATVSFDNKLKRGDLQVIKSSEDGLVEGVWFHLFGTSLSGQVVDLYTTTNGSGIARFEDVPISGETAYTLEEVDTAIRYVVPESVSAPILWNEVTERSVSNVLKKFCVEVTKTDIEMGASQGDASLAGAVYGLYQGDTLMATYTTGTDGSFVSDYFICGEGWTLKELNPSEGYLLDPTVHEIPADPGCYTIERNLIAKDVTETVIKGRIQLVKHTDMKLEDQLSETEEETTEESATLEDRSIPTPESDSAEKVSDGASETESTDESAEETTNESADDTTEEILQESSTAESLADASVAETSTLEESASEGTLDSAAESDVDVQDEDLSEDLTEAETSLGALVENDVFAPEPLPEEEIEASGGAGFIEQPEEGAVFQIYLEQAGSFEAAKESERDILMTDQNGFAVSKELPYGRYIVHQIEGMEGKAFVPDFIVYIYQDQETYSYILNNQTMKSFLRVEKHDAETGKIIPVSGIGFQVKDLSTGEWVCQNVYYPTPATICVFYTNSEGWLMLPCELPYGQYELIEAVTCHGYVLDSAPVPFTIDGTEDVVVVEKQNVPQKGRIKITKTGEVFASVNHSGDMAELDTGSSIPVMYQPVYEECVLSGAVYEIKAAEDIYTLDGTLRVASGEVVDTVTTGADGIAVSKELYLGTYEICEIQAPDTMVLSTEPQYVELTYAGQEVLVTEASAAFCNERQRVKIQFAKELEEDDVFGIGFGDELAYVSFGLYAAEDLVASDGTMIPADGLIEIVSVNSAGVGLCQTDLPLGSYYLQERTTDAHYTLDDTRYPIVFSYAGQEIPVVEINANDGEAIENALVYGSVSGRKENEDGNGLGGAIIGLFASDMAEFTVETALTVTESAEDGSFRFEHVPYGTWYIREIRQPDGYVLCEEVIPVNIEDHEQVVEVTLVNEWIRGSLTLTKYDKDYPDNKLSGAVFEVYRDVNDDQLLDEADVLLGEMEETEPGIYEVSNIAYGGVLIRETEAPEGFYLDENVYYVMIEADGEVYSVENEAGVGFYNEVHRGGLKIVKTSSDGRLEGFSFRVAGEDYDQTFKTDKNGEILIENLRVGTYTISEVEDSVSADYFRPSPKTVEVVVDALLEVDFHNYRIPEPESETPEVTSTEAPETGDNSNMFIWGAVALLGFGGIVCSLIIRNQEKAATGKTKKK